MSSFKDFFWNGEAVTLYVHRPDMKVAEIASACGKSSSEIYRVLHQSGVRPNRLKAGHEAVLSLAERGWNMREIAGITGYTERNVRYILSRR